MYSSVVLDRFFNPRHVGDIPSPDGLGIVGTPGTGDFVQMFLRISGGRVVEAKFRCFTCPVAVAACDMAAELAHSLSLEEAWRLSPADISLALQGVPEEKMSRCRLAISALRAALKDHENKKEEKGNK